jgi:hypothetical protein
LDASLSLLIVVVVLGGTGRRDAPPRLDDFPPRARENTGTIGLVPDVPLVVLDGDVIAKLLVATGDGAGDETDTLLGDAATVATEVKLLLGDDGPLLRRVLGEAEPGNDANADTCGTGPVKLK